VSALPDIARCSPLSRKSAALVSLRRAVVRASEGVLLAGGVLSLVGEVAGCARFALLDEGRVVGDLKEEGRRVRKVVERRKKRKGERTLPLSFSSAPLIFAPMPASPGAW
jgi:hypothetical protein